MNVISRPPVKTSSTGCVGLLILVLLGACSEGGEEATARPPAVVITVDTLRADHLACYGYQRPTSPNIDALAADGTRFDQAVAPRPLTCPSVASMLTGQYSFRHGVTSNYMQLHDSWPTLAEVLKDEGYRTAAFISNYVLVNELSNFQQGFDQYDDFLPDREKNRKMHERRAEQTIARAIEWLGQVEVDEEFFLWVHLVDPHGPYTPPEYYRERFKGGRQRLLDEKDIPRYQRLGTVNHSDYVNYYDAEIAYTDAQIGLLLQALKEGGHYGRSLVLFHADHGESLGEFGAYYQHGQDLYEPCVRVPMVLKVPDRVEPLPPVCDRMSAVIDILPTVLEGVGVAVPGGIDGESLIALARTGQRQRPALLLERVGPKVRKAKGLQVGLRTETDKLLYHLDPDDWMRVQNREYYVLGEENEEGNVYRTEDPTIMAREDDLMAWMREIVEYERPFEVETWAPDDHGDFIEKHNEETSRHLEALKALGYTDE